MPSTLKRHSSSIMAKERQCLCDGHWNSGNRPSIISWNNHLWRSNTSSQCQALRVEERDTSVNTVTDTKEVCTSVRWMTVTQYFWVLSKTLQGCDAWIGSWRICRSSLDRKEEVRHAWPLFSVFLASGLHWLSQPAGSWREWLLHYKL